MAGEDSMDTGRGPGVGALLRRIRRTADLSQRQLADGLGVARSSVARAETGERDLPASVLARAAELAGLRLALVDGSGAEVAGMDPEAVRDAGGRHFPAHLDPRHGDIWWWHGSERYSRERPRYTFDRDRTERDERRAVDGIPVDHQPPRPGDSLEERARVRREAALARQAAEHRRRFEEAGQRGWTAPWTPTCTCPPDCDELLFPTRPLTAAQNAVPHIDECPCRCDIA
jgi:transcriptional regulator with XRE-family HTH domain